jgi:hypothetical protein
MTVVPNFLLAMRPPPPPAAARALLPTEKNLLREQPSAGTSLPDHSGRDLVSADCFSVICHFARLRDFAARCWEIRGKANLGFVGEQRNGEDGPNLPRFDSGYEEQRGRDIVKNLYIDCSFATNE